MQGSRVSLIIVAVVLLACLLAVPATAEGITLEAGVGTAMLRQVDLTVQVGINLGDLPQDWPVIGGRDFVIMAGWLADGPLFAGPAFEIDDKTRIGFPIWREDRKPAIDVALFYVTPIKW